MRCLKVSSFKLLNFCACLYGFVYFTNVVSSGITNCANYTKQSRLFAHPGDNITFQVWMNHISNRREEFFLYRRTEERRNRICHMLLDRDILLNDFVTENCFSGYESRISIDNVNAFPAHFIRFDIELSATERSDNGTYLVLALPSRIPVCFTVYMLGPPVSNITVMPAAIEVGNAVVLKCSSKTTTFPETHDLQIHTSWYTDGQAIKFGGRFRVNSNQLFIHVVTQADINLVITCEATERRGLTTRTNTTLPIYWGPDPVPKLQPPNTFYYIEPGIQLPTIQCSVDCHPACELRWYKLGSPVVLSFNGTLSLGILNRTSTGEYTCTTTHSITTKKSRISIIFLLKEDHVPMPELQPSNTFYHIESGVHLPTIQCSVDCQPVCELRWYKLRTQTILSFNGTLSLGILDRNTAGEYTCTATNPRTAEKSSISLYIQIKEDQVPVPELQPSNTFYHIESGVHLPTIHCSVDCHPDCELRWYKLSTQSILSFNGTLSLGILDKNSTGEYTCTATYPRTTEKRSMSLYILIKEDQKHTNKNTSTTVISSEFTQNYTPLGAVGGALCAALLLALILVIFLLRRGNTTQLCTSVSSSSHRDDPMVMSLQNTYGDLPVNERASQHYEALNTGVMRAVNNDSGTNKAPWNLTRGQNEDTAEMRVYENTRIDQSS